VSHYANLDKYFKSANDFLPFFKKIDDVQTLRRGKGEKPPSG